MSMQKTFNLHCYMLKCRYNSRAWAECRKEPVQGKNVCTVRGNKCKLCASFANEFALCAFFFHIFCLHIVSIIHVQSQCIKIHNLCVKTLKQYAISYAKLKVICTNYSTLCAQPFSQNGTQGRNLFQYILEGILKCLILS